jgi:hypothetical protein
MFLFGRRLLRKKVLSKIRKKSENLMFVLFPLLLRVNDKDKVGDNLPPPIEGKDFEWLVTLSMVPVDGTEGETTALFASCCDTVPRYL